MREDAKLQMSDIAFIEALNDDIVDEVLRLELEYRYELALEECEVSLPIDASNALRYLLMDELNLGKGSRHKKEVVNLRITLPAK